jgi:hypothetical protein
MTVSKIGIITKKAIRFVALYRKDFSCKPDDPGFINSDAQLISAVLVWISRSIDSKYDENAGRAM